MKVLNMSDLFVPKKRANLARIDDAAKRVPQRGYSQGQLLYALWRHWQHMEEAREK